MVEQDLISLTFISLLGCLWDFFLFVYIFNIYKIENDKVGNYFIMEPTSDNYKQVNYNYYYFFFLLSFIKLMEKYIFQYIYI